MFYSAFFKYKKPIYLWVALLIFLFGFFTMIMPICDLMYQKGKTIRTFNSEFNNYQLSVLYISLFVSGFLTCVKCLSFATYHYWQLEDLPKKTKLKVVK